MGKQRGFSRWVLCCLNIFWNNDLLHRLAYLDQLRRARLRMGLQLAPFRPVIRLVVVIHIAQQQTGIGLVDDQTNIAAHPHRPEILVPRLVQLVEAQARIGRIDLQVERRGLGGFLLIAGEFGEAVGEGVGDEKVHHSAPARQGPVAFQFPWKTLPLAIAPATGPRKPEIASTTSAKLAGAVCNRLLRTNPCHWVCFAGSLAKALVKATGVAGITVPRVAKVLATARANIDPSKSN